MNNYKFYITVEGTQTQVYPLNNRLSWTYSKEGKQLFYRRKLDTKLLFNNDDFEYFLGLSNCDCKAFELSITRFCGGVWSQYFVGFFTQKLGDWDEDKCLVSFEVRSVDEYSCITDNWTQKKNILLVAQNIEVGAFVGELQYETCDLFGVQIPVNTDYHQYLADCLTTPLSWSVIGHNGSDNTNGDGSIITNWVREIVYNGSMPVGSGWIAEGLNWVRQVPTKRVERVETNTTIAETWILSIETRKYDNGRRLESVLNYLNTCNYAFVSNFFSINSDNTQPVNGAYEKAIQDLSNVILFQKSDIRRSQASENATIAMLSLKELLQILEGMYQVYLVLDGSILRLEHISYFSSVQGVDISQSKYIKSQNKYTFDSTKNVKRENFTWMESGNTDFVGTSIEYDNMCTDSENETNINVSTVTTDIEHIAANKDDIENKGFVFVASYLYNNLYYINKEKGELSNANHFNNALSWANLQHSFYKHNRPFKSGLMNNVESIFKDSIKTKKQEPLTLILDCQDMGLFTPNQLLKTGLGWGEIDKCTIDTNCKLSLDLVFDC